MSDDLAVTTPTLATARASERTSSRAAEASLWVAVYSLAFATAAILVFGYLATQHKSVVWSIDGVTQHFPAFVYVQKTLRGFIAHPTAGISLWSWELGLGADVLGTLAYYGLGDPFALIGAAFPVARAEAAFTVAFLLRLYVAGLFSLLYFKTMGASRSGSIVGALVYVFTMFTMFAVLRHPFFANALVFLPPILTGIERVLRGRRPYLLVVSVFVAALGNFYFFYMQTLIAVLYAFVRYFDLAEPEGRLRRLPATVVRVAGLYLLGVAMAAVTLVPVLVTFFSSSRAPTGPRFGWLYKIPEYGAYIVDLTSSFRPVHSTYLGFASVGVAAALVYLVRPDAWRGIKIMLVAFAVFGALPIFGTLFNGLAFPSNRFLFGWGLFIGLAVADLLTPKRLPKLNEVGIAALVYGLFALLVAMGKASQQTLVPLLFGAAALGLVAVAAFVCDHPGGRLLTRPVAEALLAPAVLALVVVNIAFNANQLYSREHDNLLKNWEDAGVMDLFARNSGGIAAKLPEGPGERTEKQAHVYGDYDVSVSSNDPLVQSYRGTAFYFSLIDGDVADFMHQLENRSVKYTVGYNGFDDRATLAAMTSTRYYLADERFSRYVPYGFEPAGVRGDALVFRNRNTLPIGFVYDRVVPRSVFARLDPLDRQQALMAGAVVDDRVATGLPLASLPQRAVDVPFTVEPFGGTKISKSGIYIPRAGKGMHLDLATPPNSEVYVELTGLTYRDKPRKADADEGEKSPIERYLDYREGNELRQGRQSVYLWYSDGAAAKGERFETPFNQYYWANRTQLVNLGYRPSSIESITITANAGGTYGADTLRVRALPMDGFDARIRELRASGLSSVRMGRDSLSGTFSSKRGGVLFLSVPYTSGWRATIDGAPVTVERVSTAFSGIIVPPGRHRLEMHYLTPGLAQGAAISAVAFAIFGGLILGDVLRRRRALAEDS